MRFENLKNLNIHDIEKLDNNEINRIVNHLKSITNERKETAREAVKNKDLTAYQNIITILEGKKLPEYALESILKCSWEEKDLAFFLTIQQDSRFRELKSEEKKHFKQAFFASVVGSSSMQFFAKAQEIYPEEFKNYLIQQFNEGQLKANKVMTDYIINNYECVLSGLTIKNFIDNSDYDSVKILLGHEKLQWFLSAPAVQKELIGMAFNRQNSEFMEYLFQKYPEQPRKFTDFFSTPEDYKHLSRSKAPFLEYFLSHFKPDNYFIELFMPHLIRSQKQENWWALATHYIEQKNEASLVSIIAAMSDPANKNKLFINEIGSAVNTALFALTLQKNLPLEPEDKQKKLKL